MSAQNPNEDEKEVTCSVSCNDPGGAQGRGRSAGQVAQRDRRVACATHSEWGSDGFSAEHGVGEDKWGKRRSFLDVAAVIFPLPDNYLA